jgi:hypothetical protein
MASFFACVYFLPESPLWLIKSKKSNDAKTVLLWLRGLDYPVDVEVKEIELILNMVGN